MSYILTKLSRSGVRYYATGIVSHVSPAGGGLMPIVAATSLFEADAHQFAALGEARGRALDLNADGIGGARWTVVPLGGESS